MSLREREEVSRGMAEGESLRQVARRLDRSASTVSREVHHGGGRACYRATISDAGARQRARIARRARKLQRRRLWAKVRELLREGWSPEQIAGRLRRDYPSDTTMQVSHETIYAALYLIPRGELRRQLISQLRQGRQGRRPRTRGVDRRGQIPNMTSIHERPAEVDQRLVPGHWEGDLIKGARNASAVGTMVERTSRLVLLTRLEDATADAVLEGFTRRFRRVPEPLRRSLTYDRGKEMAAHETLAERVSIRVYFADPHSPWQRGTIENANGLLRQYLPKGSDLSTFSQHQLNSIARRLNTRPRKCLEFATPLEVFQQLHHHPSVALGT
jgi:IS30 family transposase